MRKAEAIDLLGGTVKAAAEALGITSSGVSQWPDELPPRIADRVLGAWLRAKFPYMVPVGSHAAGGSACEESAG